MTSAAVVDLLACGIFGAAMLHATVTDLRHGHIRNWLVAALAAAWLPMALAAGMPGPQMAAAAGAAALVFAGGFGCFAAGWLGGGDVKLATAAVLWLGAAQAMPFLLLASVIGAALTALVIAARRRGIGHGAAGPLAAAAVSRPVIYGPALAGAGLALLHRSYWAAAL